MWHCPAPGVVTPGYVEVGRWPTDRVGFLLAPRDSLRGGLQTVGLRRICCETALRHHFLACFRLDMFNIRPKTGQFWRSQADFSRRLPKSDSLLAHAID
jgi:hypothetical protein